MPKGLKPSYYSHLFDLEDGTHLAFNAMSGAFIKIHNEDYESVKELLTDPERFKIVNDNDKKLLQSAKCSRFVIDSDVDEYQILKFRENLGKYSTEIFHLTIIPTMDCNFACPYCYENKEKVKMEPELQAGLCKWVDVKLAACRDFSISWFGGEPLLALDVIRNLTGKFIKLCNKHNLNYSAGITTNGFYLTPKIIKELDNLAIKEFQVTLDGPPSEHNKRRKLINGKGTFKTIIDNLTYLSGCIDDVRIVIRVNYDMQSFNKLPELFSYIPESLKNKSEIYFRQVFPPPKWWDAEKPTKISSVPPKQAPINSLSVEKLAHEHGFKLFMISHKLKSGYCEADYLNRLVVDHECNLHKCTVAFDKQHRVGYITPQGRAVINTPAMAKWMLRSTLEKSNCMECKILPICMGGCSLNTLCNKGKDVCGTVNDYHMIIENLRLLYKNITLRSNSNANANYFKSTEIGPPA